MSNIYNQGNDEEKHDEISTKSSYILNIVVMAEEDNSGAVPDPELEVNDENDLDEDSNKAEGVNDDGETVPDPTSAKVEAEEKAKADDASIGDNEEGDKSKDDDGRDSLSDEPIAVKSDPTQSGNSASGSGNKLLKELDDEAPKTFPQVVSGSL